MKNYRMYCWKYDYDLSMDLTKLHYIFVSVHDTPAVLCRLLLLVNCKLDSVGEVLRSAHCVVRQNDVWGAVHSPSHSNVFKPPSRASKETKT